MNQFNIDLQWHLRLALSLLSIGTLSSQQVVEPVVIGAATKYRVQQVACSGVTYRFTCDKPAYVIKVGRGLNWGVMGDRTEPITDGRCHYNSSDCYSHTMQHPFLDAYFTPVNNANLGVVPASDINPWYNKPRYLEDSVENLLSACDESNSCLFTIPSITVSDCEQRPSHYAFLLLSCIGLVMNETRPQVGTEQPSGIVSMPGAKPTSTRHPLTDTTRPPENNGGQSDTGPPDENGDQSVTSTSHPDENGDQSGTSTSPPDNNGGQSGTSTSPPDENGDQSGTGTSPPDNNSGQSGTSTSPPDENGGQSGTSSSPLDNNSNQSGPTESEGGTTPTTGITSGRESDGTRLPPSTSAGPADTPITPPLPTGSTPPGSEFSHLPPGDLISGGTPPLLLNDTYTWRMPPSSGGETSAASTDPPHVSLVTPSGGAFTQPTIPPWTGKPPDPQDDLTRYKVQAAYCSNERYWFTCDKPGHVIWVGRGMAWGRKTQGSPANETCMPRDGDCSVEERNNSFLMDLYNRCNYRPSCWFDVPVAVLSTCGGYSNWVFLLFHCGMTKNEQRPALPSPIYPTTSAPTTHTYDTIISDITTKPTVTVTSPATTKRTQTQTTNKGDTTTLLRTTLVTSPLLTASASQITLSVTKSTPSQNQGTEFTITEKSTTEIFTTASTVPLTASKWDTTTTATTVGSSVDTQLSTTSSVTGRTHQLITTTSPHTTTQEAKPSTTHQTLFTTSNIHPSTTSNIIRTTFTTPKISTTPTIMTSEPAVFTSTQTSPSASNVVSTTDIPISSRETTEVHTTQTAQPNIKTTTAVSSTTRQAHVPTKLSSSTTVTVTSKPAASSTTRNPWIGGKTQSSTRVITTQGLTTVPEQPITNTQRLSPATRTVTPDPKGSTTLIRRTNSSTQPPSKDGLSTASVISGTQSQLLSEMPLWVWIICGVAIFLFILVIIGTIIICHWKKRKDHYNRPKAERRYSHYQSGGDNSAHFDHIEAADTESNDSAHGSAAAFVA